MAQSYFPNAQSIIDNVLRCIRAVDPDSSLDPTTTQRTNALENLNLLITSWQAKGMQVWCTKNATHVLTADTASYTAGPGGAINIARPNSVQQAWIRNTTVTPNVDIPLRIIGREEYNSYSAKDTVGPPVSLYYDPRYDLPASNSGASAKGTVFIWPVPDTTLVATYDLYFVYTRPIQDFSAVTDGIDCPQEWYNAIKWNMASQLCPDFGVPVLYWDRIAGIAKKELESVEGWDREEGSLFIYPAQEWGR